MKMRKICSVMLCILMVVMLVNPVAHAEDSVEKPSTFVEIDVEDFGKTKVKVYEGFDFVNRSSAECNWKLALNGAVLSKEIYEGQARDVFKTLGYDITWENISGDDGLPGRTMAYKLLVDSNGNRKNVFAVAVRGTSNTTDLFATDIVDGGTSMFSRTTSYIVEELKAFVTICTGKTLEELEGEDNYFFFTGYSLGGAVANNLSIDGTVMKLAKNDKNRIYTYTFESPHTCIAFFWMNVGEMSNAFNLKDVDDPVTNLPPYMWSTTYGKDVVFSVKDLSGVILKILYPDTKYNDLTEFLFSLKCPPHHNLIGDIVYILQQGQLVDEDYVEVNINHKEIPSVSRLSEAVQFSRTDENENWMMSSKEIYQYDEQGRLVERRICSAEGEIKEQEIIEYNQSGNIVKTSQTGYYYNSPRGIDVLGVFGVGGSPTRINTYYDENGRVTRMTTDELETGGEGFIYDFTYEEDGRCLIGWTDYGPNGPRMASVINTVLDADGRLIKGFYSAISGRIGGIIKIEYDDSGRVVAKRKYSVPDEWSWEKDIPDTVLVLYSEQLSTYNEHGDLIRESSWVEGFEGEPETDETSYDISYYPNGNKETVHTFDVPSESSHTWYYSEDGKLISERWSAESIYSWEKEYFYGENGQLVKETYADKIISFDDNDTLQSSYREMTETYYIYQDFFVDDEASVE